jgi:phage baseplate assembly protein W
MSDPADFVGNGLAWPLAVDQSGSLAMTGGTDGIASALRMILSTAPGERLMRPQFGCAIWNLLFEPINANTLGLMSEAVREAVGRWEPRIELEDVRVEPDQGDEGRVRIHIDYRTKATNDRRNLVFPFYVIPRETES